MKIIGEKFNIEDIRFGHESEGSAFGYITKNKPDVKDAVEAWNIIEAHENGFECGIKWLANYLSEYGIQIELHDKVVLTTPKEHWYSGEITKHNN